MNFENLTQSSSSVVKIVVGKNSKYFDTIKEFKIQINLFWITLHIKTKNKDFSYKLVYNIIRMIWINCEFWSAYFIALQIINVFTVSFAMNISVRGGCRQFLIYFIC